MQVTDNVVGLILVEVDRFRTQMNREVCSCALPPDLWRSLIQQCSSLSRGEFDPDLPTMNLVTVTGLVEVFVHDRPEIMWGFRADH